MKKKHANIYFKYSRKMVCQKKKKEYQKCYHEKEDGNMKNLLTKKGKINTNHRQSSVMTLLIEKKEIVKKFMSKEKLKEN